MNRRNSTSLLSVIVISSMWGCASGPDTFSTAAMSIAADVMVQAEEVAQPSFKVAAVVIPEIDHWSQIFDYAVPEPALTAHRNFCGLVVMPSPAAGPWRLAGATPMYYTPVLDIYAERRKRRPANEPVYYHFRLSDDAR